MKIRALFLSGLLVFSFVTLSGQKASEEIQRNGRTEKAVNAHWTFNYFPGESSGQGYEQVSFDDSGWPLVSIPHTWNTYETTGILHPFITGSSEKDNPYWWVGWGWYRKHFSIKGELSDKEIFIRFDGVQKYCRVWINGKLLGDHKGGYGLFDFDLTDYIKPGEDNVLAVAVQNVQDDKNSIPPMVPGSFDVYGGIFRDVSIIIRSKLYIPEQGSAEHEGGTFITTPGLSEKEGQVRIRTWVKNDYTNARKCFLQTSVIDAEGKTVQVLKSDADIQPGEIREFDQLSKTIKRPRLWSPADPYLYSVLSEVISDKTVVDSFTSTFGFRWFSWDYSDNSLVLNGHRTRLKGGGLVEEYPWIGGAVPGSISVNDIMDMKNNLDYNFLRTAYYPENKIVYDMADRKGLIVAEESPNINNQDFSPAAQEQQIREMIRRDRNHPSVLFWSTGNETDHPATTQMVENEDTTRIIAAMKTSGAKTGHTAVVTEKNFSFGGIQAQSARGWYSTDSAKKAAVDLERCVTEDMQVTELAENDKSENGNVSSGIYQDHGTGRIFQDVPLRYTDMSGIVDMYRIPKYSYFFRKALFSGDPVVFIEPDHWIPSKTGHKTAINVITNCDRLELKVNGQSKGTQSPAGPGNKIITFKDITVENAPLTVIGTKNGKEISCTVNMSGEAARLELTSSDDSIAASLASVAVITADIVDAGGNKVFGASNAVKWSVSGPATLVGPSFYESESGKHDMEEGTGYTEMPVSNVIRSTGKPGNICVTVFSSGLASDSVIIKARNVIIDNSIINEPVPDPLGRNRVTRPGIIYDRVREQKRDIKYTTGDFAFERSAPADYKKRITDFIIKNNPGVDSASVEFRSLIKILGRQLRYNNGIMTAKDYNYNVGHYNKCRIILGYIKSTKLPGLFKEGLRSYYANAIIIRGIEKDAEDEMNWMNWIPSGGTVVYSATMGMTGLPANARTSESTDLSDLIDLVYPVYSKFSDEAKARALSFISRMNPWVRQVLNENSNSGEDGRNPGYSYKVEQGMPILIPELKFISE